MTSRLPIFAALLALLAFAGCGRDSEEATVAVSPEEKAYQGAIDDINAERKRLMTELAEAQKSGDQEKVKAAAKALADNRVRAADTVRDYRNSLSSSKEQTK